MSGAHNAGPRAGDGALGGEFEGDLSVQELTTIVE
jgi:hypothetical protein